MSLRRRQLVYRGVFMFHLEFFFLIHCLHTFTTTWVFLWVRKTLHRQILVTSSRQKNIRSELFSDQPVSSEQVWSAPCRSLWVWPSPQSHSDVTGNNTMVSPQQLIQRFREKLEPCECVNKSSEGKELTWLIAGLLLSLFPFLYSSQKETKVTFLYISDSQTGLLVLALVTWGDSERP